MSTSPQSTAFEEISAVMPAWKQEVNARLQAHRSRRTSSSEAQAALPGMERPTAPRSQAVRAARVAARVAERYSQAPTYSEMLAAEAANAARAAEAAARAAQDAHDAAQAVTDVLWAGLDLEDTAATETRFEPASEVAARPETVVERVPEPNQYRIHPDSLPAPRSTPRAESARPRIAEASDIFDAYEDAVVAPAQLLPARVLEFPRELIAARKARPRLAEGPLRDAEGEPEKGQLRIFEVEPEAISHEVSADATPVLPEWHSIQLDARPREERSRQVEAGYEKLPEGCAAGDAGGQAASPTGSQPGISARGVSGRNAGHPEDDSPSSLLDMLPLSVASIEDRMMAGIVDAALVLAAFLMFVLVFVACTAHPPTGKPALISAGIVLAAFFVLYEWLFFTYSESTPGMRYAKIALCTFDDENPTRKAMRGRVAALILSAVPLGLGFLWALLDDDRLGWHDRMTRTYQRSYR